MIATIHILFDTVQVPLYAIWIAVPALFIFAFVIGVYLGRIDGENQVARWYEERERARRHRHFGNGKRKENR